jgi:hypothetical protein
MKLKYLLLKSWAAIAFFGLLGMSVTFGQTLKHSYTFETDLSDGTGTADGTSAGGAAVSGGGLVLDANGKYISFVGTDLDLNSYGAITMEYVFKGSTTANTAWNWTGYFGDNGGANNFRTSLGHWNDEIRTVYGGTATYEIKLDGQDVNDGNKHHIVTILTADSVLYYEDGQRLGGIINGDGSFTIGAAQSYLGKGSDAWGDATWQGVIYEFNIYDGKMDAATVKTRFNAYLSVSDARLASLTADLGTLTPAFNAGVSHYALVVPTGTTSVNLTAVAAAASATVTGGGAIDISAGEKSDTITVTSVDETAVKQYVVDVMFADPTCYEPLYDYRTNLVPDPTCDNRSLFGGWGAVSVVYGFEAYCGTSAMKLTAPDSAACSAALDMSPFVWQSNRTYRLHAMVKTDGGSIGILARGSGNEDKQDFGFAFDSKGEWVELDTIIKTGTIARSGFLSFNTCDYYSDALVTYIDNYEVYQVSSTVTLSELKQDETTVTGFAPETYEYNVVLAAGTTAVPVVTATPTDAHATYVITPATTLPGTTTVVVTAEDGFTKGTYTINFSVYKSNVATLSDLTVDGTTVTGFNKNTFTYKVELPYGTTVVPTVTATASDTKATVEIIPAEGLPGITTIDVTAEDGTKLEYTIEFKIGSSIENNGENLVKVYPTTSNGEFTVESKTGSMITVYDIKGVVILNQVAEATKQNITLQNEGMYIVRVENNETSRLFKVFKIK